MKRAYFMVELPVLDHDCGPDCPCCNWGIVNGENEQVLDVAEGDAGRSGQPRAG
jgi:hypothetical protein